MGELHRTCSECSSPLTNPKAKTCSDNCRGKRSRRLKRSKTRAKREPTESEQALAELAKLDDTAREVMQEELRPIVREAITEDTLRGIERLVGLVPKMVDALEGDLGDEDPAVRQKAYTLGMRYTLGHGALVGPADTQPQGGMTVVFEGMPRPESVPSDAVEERVCQDCALPKPTTEFVAHSDRCQACYQLLQDKAQELLDG